MGRFLVVGICAAQELLFHLDVPFDSIRAMVSLADVLEVRPMLRMVQAIPVQEYPDPLELRAWLVPGFGLGRIGARLIFSAA